MTEEHGGDVTPEMIMPMMGSLFALIPVLILTGIIVRSVLTGAIFRAVIMPRDSGWAYLRLGARELWLALLFIVLGILGFFLGMLCMLVVVPIQVAAISIEDPVFQMSVMRLAMLPLYGIMAFLTVRFGMSLPMTFTESKFRLFESWDFTRGNGWRLFLMLLLMCAIGVVTYVLFAVIVIAIIAAVLGGHFAAGSFDEERLKGFFEQDPAVLLQTALPWVIGIGVAASIVGVLFAVIFTAPFAEAYRQIRGDGGDPLSEPASDALAA
jgi:MFS family permease